MIVIVTVADLVADIDAIVVVIVVVVFLINGGSGNNGCCCCSVLLLLMLLLLLLLLLLLFLPLLLLLLLLAIFSYQDGIPSNEILFFEFHCGCHVDHSVFPGPVVFSSLGM